MSTAEMEQVWRLSPPLREVWDGWWGAGYGTERRPWLVGQAPSEGYGLGTENEDYTPCGGAFSRRLVRAMGGETQLDYLTFMAMWRRRNVLDHYPGSGPGKGDRFPLDEARRAAEVILGEVPPGRPLVACGKQTARAFGVSSPEYFAWEGILGTLVAPFPHPSGINRFWNEEENVERAGEFLRDVLTGREP